MATRVATGVRSAWLAGLLATALAVPALAAGETTADRLLNAAAEPGNWLTHHKDYAATRYSTLDEITKDNVKDLKVAWTFALGGIEGGGIWPHGGLEGTPIVEDGAMYVTDGWGAVYKLDVSDGPGKLVWKMDPGTDKDWSGAMACCGVNTAASRCGGTR
jgi:alcohol dehydrogenase (cytochrome c)